MRVEAVVKCAIPDNTGWSRSINSILGGSWRISACKSGAGFRNCGQIESVEHRMCYASSMSIEILDADSIDRLPLTAGGSLDPASRYIASFVRNGPPSYVDNANVQMRALMIDRKVLPLVISERVDGNSNVCSAYAHYFEYALQELAKRYRRALFGLKPLRSLLGTVLRSGSIDRIVFVNNWLLTTNPSHGLSAAQIAALTAYLRQRYPDSAIVFRSVNPLADRVGLDALRTNRYRLIPSRRVYMLDTGSQRYLERSNTRDDLRRLRQTSYSIVSCPESLAPHASRIASLYRELYLGKYSLLNPQFNTDFISLTLNERFFTYRALIEDCRVDAFISYFERDGVMTGSLLGYDRQRPRNLGLYRLAFALMIAEAAKRKSLLNISAGGGDFKMLRGAVRVQECDAVYDRHLPARRRLLWAGIQMAAVGGGRWGNAIERESGL